MYPLDNWNNLKKTYTFGVKTFYNDFHLGVDFVVPEGTFIYAPSDGHVTETYGQQGGNTIHFRDSKNNIIRFLHLHGVTKTGEVREGDVIGLTGNTGVSTAPHVHIDVSKNKLDLSDRNNFIDPLQYFIYMESKTLRVVLLDNTSGWDSLPQKIEKVKKDFEEKTKIRFEISIKKINIPTEGIEWVGQGNGEYEIAPAYVENNFMPLAVGFDICVYLQQHAHWHKLASPGYADNRDFGRYGRQFIAMKAEENGRTRDEDECVRRLRHELCHTILDLADVPEDQDTVHEHDYRTPSEWWKSVESVDISKIPLDYEGKLIKMADSEKVYLVEHGKRRWLENEITYFLYTGRPLSDILTIPTRDLIRHPRGADILYKDQPEGLKKAVEFAAKNPSYVLNILKI